LKKLSGDLYFHFHNGLNALKTIFLPIIIFLTAFLHIRAEYCGPRWQIYLFKPLTTLFILLLAIFAAQPLSPRYQWFIELGLIFSLGGDIFLMLPKDRFIAGLVSFLAAHVCYIAAFSQGIHVVSTPWVLLPFLLTVIIFVGILWPDLAKMKLPVIIYAVAIGLMCWLATERWLQIGEMKTFFAFGGAMLFIVSDASLAYNRFVKRFSAAQATILITYYFAQYLIASSV